MKNDTCPPHDYEQIDYTVEDDGGVYVTYTCKNCGDTYTQYFPPNDEETPEEE